MKQLIALACFMTLVFFLTPAMGQSSPTLVLNPVEPKTERQKRFWHFSWEFTTTNKVEKENKVGLMESPTTSYTSRFTTGNHKRDFFLQSTAGFTTRQFSDDRVFNFRAGVTQKLAYEATFTADTEFTFTRFKRVGKTGFEFAKKFTAEKGYVKPFSRVDYYFPLGNDYRIQNYSHTGVVWSNGAVTELDLKPFVFENKTQFILDSGAIIKGQRSLFNTEIMFGYKLNRICFGPVIGYTHLLSGTFPHKNSTLAGLYVRYR